MSEVPAPVDADRSALRRSIAGRLLFWFLVIALIPCAILTAITARIASTALEKSVRDNLVQIAAGKVKLEASGGINKASVTEIAETGVDLISSGALTHSAPILDLGLDIEIG